MRENEPVVMLFGGPLDGQRRRLGEDGVMRETLVYTWVKEDVPGQRGSARYRLGNQGEMPTGVIRYDFTGESEVY